jgi:hypothetical protein
MSNYTIALLLFSAVVILLLAGIIAAAAGKDKKALQRSGSFASMAAFHDFQGKDKQNAIETIIEKQAEKKWEDEESGEEKRKSQE